MKRLSQFFSAVLVIIAAIGLAHPVKAQTFPFEMWHDGKVVLEEGDTIRGLVKYDLSQDLVQVNTKKRAPEVFTARKVLYFEIFDISVNRYRRFFSLPFALSSSQYKSQVFFELLCEGKLTVLNREKLEFRTYSSPYFMGSYSRQVLVYQYFMLEEDGDIVEYDVTDRTDLLKPMGKKAEDVEKFMKKNRLRTDEKYDVAEIVEYYNSFFKN